MKNTALFFISLIIFCLPLIAYNGNSQDAALSVAQGVPVFRHNVFRTLTENTQNFIINIHADISNDRLQFVKEDSVYHSSYSLSVAIFEGGNTNGIPKHQLSEIKTVDVNEYKETLSSASGESHNYKFEVPKGVYTSVITVRDLNSNKSHTVRTEIEFEDNSGTIISDLRMVYWDDDKDFESSYESLINNIVDKQSPYTGALFEILTPSSAPVNFTIRYRLINSEGDTVYDDRFDGVTRDKLQMQVLKIPLDNLNAGNYKIEADIEISGSKFSRNTFFYLRWKDLSLNVSDIDSALEQMLYIVEYDSVKHVFDFEEEEKREWFKNYWNELEESLSLKKNSLMEEYFRRIAYANMHFSVPKKDGWKTDMGKVLCLMGDPDEVQNFPFIKNQKPYEVWTYYDINAQFIFDYNGGEYRLRK